jgi:hypothetical protein
VKEDKRKRNSKKQLMIESAKEDKQKNQHLETTQSMIEMCEKRQTGRGN